MKKKLFFVIGALGIVSPLFSGFTYAQVPCSGTPSQVEEWRHFQSMALYDMEDNEASFLFNLLNGCDPAPACLDRFRALLSKKNVSTHKLRLTLPDEEYFRVSEHWTQIPQELRSPRLLDRIKDMTLEAPFSSRESLKQDIALSLASYGVKKEDVVIYRAYANAFDLPHVKNFARLMVRIPGGSTFPKVEKFIQFILKGSFSEDPERHPPVQVSVISVVQESPQDPLQSYYLDYERTYSRGQSTSRFLRGSVDRANQVQCSSCHINGPIPIYQNRKIQPVLGDDDTTLAPMRRALMESRSRNAFAQAEPSNAIHLGITDGLLPQIPACQPLGHDGRLKRATNCRSCHNGRNQPQLVMVQSNEFHFKHAFERMPYVTPLTKREKEWVWECLVEDYKSRLYKNLVHDSCQSSPPLLPEVLL